ncbi:MAG: MipA/OmpV family protein [Spirochaetota bacterium]
MRHCLLKLLIRTAAVPALSIFFMLSMAFAEEPGAEVKESEPKPCAPSTFEWGAGLLSLRMNHYRGSDQYKNYFIPSPYFKYRSENIEAETSYVRGTLYKNDYLVLKLSFMVGLSVESEENRAREGMPDLGYMLETGPMLIVKLWESAGRAHLLTFESPVRYVFATDFTGVEPVGVLGLPYLNLTSLPRAYTLGWKSEFSVALMIGSRGYHDYFYTVPAKYARPERPGVPCARRILRRAARLDTRAEVRARPAHPHPALGLPEARGLRGEPAGADKALLRRRAGQLLTCSE